MLSVPKPAEQCFRPSVCPSTEELAGLCWKATSNQDVGCPVIHSFPQRQLNEVLVEDVKPALFPREDVLLAAMIAVGFSFLLFYGLP